MEKRRKGQEELPSVLRLFLLSRLTAPEAYPSPSTLQDKT